MKNVSRPPTQLQRLHWHHHHHHIIGVINITSIIVVGITMIGRLAATILKTFAYMREESSKTALVWSCGE